MTLPVSSYEELLERVRNLTSETIQLNQEITMSLYDGLDKKISMLHNNQSTSISGKNIASAMEENIYMDKNQIPSNNASNKFMADHEEKFQKLNKMNDSVTDFKNCEFDTELKDIDEKIKSEKLLHKNNCYLYDKSTQNLGLWHSSPGHMSDFYNIAPALPLQVHQNLSNDLSSSLNLNNGSCTNLSQSERTYNHQQLDIKVEMVYNLVAMLGTNNREDMSQTFLAMSSTAESCHVMRQSGCIPLLVQLIYSSELDAEVKCRAAKALYNIVHFQTDEKAKRREIKVLSLLEQIREYSEILRRKLSNSVEEEKVNVIEHPVAIVGALMKFSFDAEHRLAICTLGGLLAIMELIQVDQEAHDCVGSSDSCITMRRYAGMSLTNLTFGDGKNKALLCSSQKFLYALVIQLKSSNEDLRQVTASVLRNLSWRADAESKEALRAAGAVTTLMVAAMEAQKEATLKSILSALWNLSAHCSMNKVDICSVPGALSFLVKMLNYKSTNNTLSIVENAGGILRNISSQIAVHEDYRQILRENNCFEILLEQLRSSSLTIVNNACGMLWNLSARCPEDQKKLWEMGATSMLRNLVHSKHKMISMGSTAALKNLLSANPCGMINAHLDNTAKSLGYRNLPTLNVRKQRALEKEIDITLSESCDDTEIVGSFNQICKLQNGKINSKNFDCARSDSKESIKSSKSDSVYERVNQNILKKNNDTFDIKDNSMHESLNKKQTTQKEQDQKFIKRYNSSMIPTPVFAKKTNEEKILHNFKSFNLKSDGQKEGIDTIKRQIPVLKKKIKSNISYGCGMHCRDKKLSADESSNEFKASETKMKSLDSKNTQPLKKAIQCNYRNKINNRHSDSECKEISKPTVTSHENQDNDNKDKEKFKPVIFEKINASSEEEEKKTELRDPEYDWNKSVYLKNCIVGITPSRTSVEVKSEFFRDTKKSYGENGSVNFNNLFQGSVDISSDNYANSFETPKTIIGAKTVISESSKVRNSKEVENNEKISSDKTSKPIKEIEEKNLLQAPSNEIKHLNCFVAIEDKSHDAEQGNVTGKKSNFFKSDEIEKCKDLNGDNNLKKSSELLPEFKIGFEISNQNWIQMEANKICQAIQEYEDVEANSQVSAISYSSFLDIGDSSIFDFTIENDNFEEKENIGKNKNDESFVYSSLTPVLNDYISLPSLGSSKVESIDAFDLESSMVSVASLVSEVAESYLNVENLDCTGTAVEKNDDSNQGKSKYEYTNKNPLNGDDGISSNNNSLTLQENSLLGTEPFERNFNTETHKNMTPKEKRRLIRDRYKTYTIRDFRSNLLKKINDDQQNFAGDCPDQYAAGLEPETESSFAINQLRTDGQTSNKLINSRSLNDLLKIGPLERKELVDNAKLVALSLKTAIEENESENSILLDASEESSQSMEIDTMTRIKDIRSIKRESNDAEPIASKPIVHKKYNLIVTKSLPNVSKNIYSLEREKTFVKKHSSFSTKSVINENKNYFSNKNSESKISYSQNLNSQQGKTNLTFKKTKPEEIQRELKFSKEKKIDRCNNYDFNGKYKDTASKISKHLFVQSSTPKGKSYPFKKK